jgi:hypothetical protein
MTPGSVPSASGRASRPRNVPACQYRRSPPGVATMLQSRFVGVTAGLGTFRIDT